MSIQLGDVQNSLLNFAADGTGVAMTESRLAMMGK